LTASWVLLSVAGAAGLVALYTAFGGRALWPRGEHSDRVIGRGVSLKGVEGLADHAALPSGVVTSYDAGWYVVNLDTPVVTDFGEVRALRIAARHRGYPISAARSFRAVAVNGWLSSKQFIAFVSVSPPNNRWRGP
jgi:hypothetical protein